MKIIQKKKNYSDTRTARRSGLTQRLLAVGVQASEGQRRLVSTVSLVITSSHMGPLTECVNLCSTCTLPT